VDPSATPWRTLEEPVRPEAGPNGAAGAGSVRTSVVPRTALLSGGAALVLVVVAFVLAFGSGQSGNVAVEGALPLGSPSASGQPSREVGSVRVVVVEIVGAVDRPGVFRLPAGSRVGDLVAAAGGYGPRVDARRAERDLNLAAPLKDGDQIRVPSRDDAATAPGRSPGPGSGGGPAPSSGPPAGPIDLNRATAAELDALPGIGPVTAAKIIASRDEQPFVAVEDLRTRKLLGEKVFSQLKDRLVVP
jgi:competence protein ComEA